MILIFARRLAGIAMTLLALFCLFVLLTTAFDGQPHAAHATAFVRLGVAGIYAIGAGLAARGAWVLLRRRRARLDVKHTPRSEPAIESWALAEGIAFERPSLMIPLFLVFSPVAAIIGIGGFVGMLVGVFALFTRSTSLGLTILGSCSIFLLVSALYFYGLRTALRVRGSPAAIIGAKGITIPRATPDYMPWNNVGSIGTFYLGRRAFLHIVPIDPTLAFPTRRGWWHGPWRDTVDIAINSRRDPLVEAATQAHAAWLDRPHDGLDTNSRCASPRSGSRPPPG